MTGDSVEHDSFDALLIAVDECGRGASEEEAYYRDLLTVLLREGPFAVAAVWSIDEQGASLVAVSPAASHLAPPSEADFPRLLANQVIELPAGEPSANGAKGTRGERLVAGYGIHGAEGILLDVTLRDARLSERLRRLVEALAELAGHVETRLRYLKTARTAAALSAADLLIQQFHRGDSLVDTALLIATGLQNALGYDRCWVCQPHPRGAQVVATSAPGDVARRQLLTQHVERVAGAALTSGRTIHWSAGDPPHAASSSLQQLAGEGLARRILALPLQPPGQAEPVAAVVLEQFSGVVNPEEESRRQALQPHAAQAMSQALSASRRSWSGRWRSDDSTAWVRRAAFAAIALASLIFLALPVPFDVEADGVLMPRGSRSVFAPADGVVSVIHVRHGQPVTKDFALIDLSSPEVDLDRERIAAQISELQARLSAIQVLRTQGRTTTGDDAGDLSAQEELLRVSLKGAEEQRALIAEQASRLAIRSPITGVVDRWDLSEALASRPVIRGQHLCDVLDVDGDWQLELRVPDKRASLVLAARGTDKALPVRYVLRTDPQTEHQTTLTAVGDRTELDPSGQLNIRATAPVQPEASVPRRAGASVVARIECGRRSRAFVWFHDLWDSLALLWL